MAHNYEPMQPVMIRLPASDRDAVRSLARRRRAGEWVALSGQEVVAHGPDGVAVFHEARRVGVVLPRLVRVSGVAEDQAIFGL